MPVAERFLGADNKVRANLFDVVESSEVSICPVKHIEGSRLVWDDIHSIDIMNLRFGNMEDRWYLGLKIKKRMDFDATLGASEVSPLVNAETQVNCRRIKGINLSAEFEYVRYSLFLSDAK